MKKADSNGTLVKADIVDLVYERVGFTRQEAAEAVDILFDEIPHCPPHLIVFLCKIKILCHLLSPNLFRLYSIRGIVFCLIYKETNP